MDNHLFITQMNTEQYEKYLSPLGRTVLTNLKENNMKYSTNTLNLLNNVSKISQSKRRNVSFEFNDPNKRLCSPRASIGTREDSTSTARTERVNAPDDGTNVQWEDFLDAQLLSGVDDTGNDDETSEKTSDEKDSVSEREHAEREIIGERRGKCDQLHREVPVTMWPKQRKQRYTTVVRSWLNDIGNASIGSDRSPDTPAAAVKQPPMEAVQTTKKRLVQSRLVNDHQVMKFRKPIV